MDIFVCIKQVPVHQQGTGGRKDGCAQTQTASQSKMNPYDLYALETALWLREARYGGTCDRGHHGSAAGAGGASGKPT